jgi:hypothetical protein
LRAHIKAAAAHAQILKQNQRKKKVEYDFSGSSKEGTPKGPEGIRGIGKRKEVLKFGGI